MKNDILFISLLTLILASCAGAASHDPSGPDGLYDTLDLELTRSDIYQNQKEKRIDALRAELASHSRPEQRFDIASRLIAEYESYNSDSALHYVNTNLASPVLEGDTRARQRLLVKKADITSHAGLFKEALEILDNVHPDPTDTALLVDYYGTYSGVYQYQSEYTTDGEYMRRNERLRALYTDSLIRIADPESFTHAITWAPEQVRAGNAAEAERRLLAELTEYRSGEREYSIIASILAYIYGEAGDHDAYRRYLAMSAISDIQGVVKENMAMRALATAIFEDGDIERANRYLKQSFADANFFAARMRNAQSSRMLPVIDEAYNAKQTELQSRQRTLLIVISVLAAVLILAIAFILRQFKVVQRAGRKTDEANAELSELSERLRQANTELADINARLQTSNAIKEEYAAMFMEYCSSTISTVKHYQQSLRVLAAQGSKAALVKKLDSSEIIDKTLDEFYLKFDEAILNIYPQFVEKFNALLQPDRRVVLHPGELLNTELRVYALIRIGIDDSAKIARFLRCSITTVYTYRSKMRRRALDPDTFEAEVGRI